MNRFMTRHVCELGFPHEIRTKDDMKAMLTYVRESADPEDRLIEWDVAFMRVRCRETAKWLREHDVNVTEREIVKYLTDEFGAVPVRTDYGMVRAWRFDGGTVKSNRKTTAPPVLRAPKIGTGESFPDSLRELLDAALTLEPRDSADRPIVWRRDGWIWLRIRPLIAWGATEGHRVRYGEREITKFLTRTTEADHVRTQYGKTLRIHPEKYTRARNANAALSARDPEHALS